MLIKDAILKYFGLNEESKERFSEAFDNPFVDEVYKKLVGEDLRLRLPLDRTLYKDFDKGWETLNNVLPRFVEQYGITYEDFYNNKIDGDKESLRIMKLIRNYLKAPTRRDSEIFLRNMAAFEHNKFREYARYCENYSYNLSDPSAFSKAVELFIDRINELRFSKTRRIEIVLSLNKADWILSTTAESWRTCLSLESPSFASYWIGLAGAVVDKNMALLYVTNGEKKRYLGNEMDKVLSRSWVLLDRNSRINVVKFYPSPLIDLKNLNKFFPVELKNVGADFVSKHRIKPLMFENGFTNYIFQDKTNPYDYNKDGFLLVGGEKGLYTFKGNRVFEGPIFEYVDGLSAFIERFEDLNGNVNLLRYFAYPVECEECGSLISSKREYYRDREGYVYCMECRDEDGFIRRDNEDYDFEDRGNELGFRLSPSEIIIRNDGDIDILFSNRAREVDELRRQETLRLLFENPCLTTQEDYNRLLGNT